MISSDQLPEDDEARRAELAASLAAVRARIRAACTAAGRDEGEVTLIAVTKTHPARDVRLLAGLGVTDVAENREQEGGPKAAACADLGLRWHFVGQLQRNKVAAVTGWAGTVHSVDRPQLVTALGAAAAAGARGLDCFVQVSLQPERSERGGARPEDVAALAELVAGTEGLRLRGLMAVAPLGEEPASAFARLRELAELVRRSHPDADALSAGMSGDLEQAVAAGATHLRIGTSLLGNRPPLR